jgi:hypothetical protein
MASSFDPKKAYDLGLVGAVQDPRSDEVFADYILRRGGNPIGEEVAHEWEFAGAGEGKLTLLFPAVEQVFPGCYPGSAQVRGDCVSRATGNCVLSSLGMEIYSRVPDEVTKVIEGAPELPSEGVIEGVVSSESLWAWRGYNGDGWIGSESAKVASERGFLLRRPYPDLKIDLTHYTEENTNLGGSRPPSDQWLAESRQHVARTATFLKGREQVRDFLAAGFGVFNTSSLGFSSVRDENGVSKQDRTWQHAECWLGYDDRPETVKRYGQALVCWLNSWGGAWNRGPRRIMGTSIDIPEGAFWALADTIDRCTCIALSSVAGWPRRKHTTFGASGNV